MIRCRIDRQKASPDFIYYLFKSPIGKGTVSTIVQQVAAAGIRGSDLQDLEFNFPPLLEQQAIAQVLSSLDDKIDLLHRQNKTLEAIAETLFRQWFVEENPDDWEGSNVSQLVRIQNGYAFKSKDFKEFGQYGVLKIKNISGGIVDVKDTDFVDHTIVDSIPKRFNVSTGDVLIGMTGAKIGKLGIVPKANKSLLLNQRVGLLEEKFKGSRFLAYILLKSEFGQDFIENAATGSAQPNISSSNIENCGFLELTESKIKECSAEIEPLYQKLIFNLSQICTLEKLRDTLLPKLVSGEVRVNLQK